MIPTLPFLQHLNRPGTPKRETFGHTVIISPDGKILALKKLGKGVIYSKIKPKLSMDLRKIIPSLI